MGAEILECCFLVPLVRDSDRRPHQPLAWTDLEDALYRCFSGSTGPELIYRSVRPVRGQYEGHDQERISDESYRYIAAVPADRLDDLRSLLRRVANTFDQQSIYLSIRGVIEFVTAVEEDGYLCGVEEEQ